MLDHRKTLKDAAGLVEMPEGDKRRLRKIMLEIYADVCSFCAEKGLTVMLGGGSLLGAIRHGGFIPWDDDMDLMMPRADYEALKTSFEGAFGGKYIIQAPGVQKQPMNLFMKVVRTGTVLEEAGSLVPGVHGVGIDIFPLDYAPEDKRKRKLKGFAVDALAYTAVCAAMFRYRTKARRKLHEGSLKMRVYYDLRLTLGAAASLAGVGRLYALHDRVSRGAASSLVTVATGRRHYRGEVRPADGMLRTVKGSFEGLPAEYPYDYIGYLTNLYGSGYMTPPPLADRERHFVVRYDLGEDRDPEASR